MATASGDGAPKVGTFVSTYAKYVEKIAAPSHALLEAWLARIESPEYWDDRAADIYKKDGHGRRDDRGKRVQRDDPRKHPIPSPIHETRCRIKYVDSAYRKLTSDRRKYGGLGAASVHKLEDVLGGRIVVYFPHQLTWIDAIIRSSAEFELHPTQKPKSFHDRVTLDRLGFDTRTFDTRMKKTSGYSSLHYILRFSANAINAPASRRPWFELQVRTLAEELWGEIEHHIGYKPERRTAFSVQRQFRVISQHLQAVDMHLDFIYDEMQHFQSDRDPEVDALLNAENLPGLLANLGIRVRQSDLGSVSDILTTYGVTTPKQLEDRLTFDCMENVRAAWRRELRGQPHPSEPDAIMLLHVMTSFFKPPTREAIDTRVKAYIELYRAMKDGLDD